MVSSQQPDLLTDERLRTALGTRTFKLYQEVGSTNDLAREWAAQGAAQGAVIVAEEQNSGRGRFGRAWFAPAGSALLMSVILRPSLSPAALARITMLAAVSVAETIESLLSHQTHAVRLKWPNDVHVAGKKVCGILPEAAWMGNAAEFVVLGIGLNVRIDFAGSPVEATAISLEPLAYQPVDRAELLAILLSRIDSWLPKLHAPTLWHAWRNRLSTLGQQITAIGASGSISGEAVDVDEAGALILRQADSTITRVVAGEVTLAK
jgi:BirA family biotin operon repressor/biotin-[acetyl-CoA-carboxylase] ligase